MRFILAAALSLLLLTSLWLFKRPNTTSPALAELADQRAKETPASLPAPAKEHVAEAVINDDQEGHSERLKVAYPETLRLTEPGFAAFNAWAETYFNAPAAEKTSLIEEGVKLAQARRGEMRELIQGEPQRALLLTFPRTQRALLPPQVVELLETPVKSRGDLFVVAALPAEGQSVKPLWRTAHVGDDIYQAHVFGRRLDEPSQTNVLLQGIALDNDLAVEEYPSRVLAPDEVEAWKNISKAAASLCEVSGLETSSQGEETLLEEEEEIVPVCSREHALKLQQELAAAEGGGGLVTAQSTTAALGIKSMIVIRVDFSDLAGEPFSLNSGTNLVRDVDKFYRDMSYNKCGFRLLGQGSAITATLRMPQTAAYYGANDAAILRRDARDAATAAGFNLNSYQYDLVCFGNVPGFSWAGLGYVGAPGSWIRGGASVGVTAHELGHNFGLNHANFWDTSGLSVIGSGSSVEYGDKFDTMGSANAGSKHFNARYKNYLQWLGSADVRVVTSSGTHRLFAHDITNSTGIRAIRTARNATTNYWLEYRGNYAGNRWMPEGLGIRWARAANQSSLLLDLTPGSTDGKDDAQLHIGRTFSDYAAGVHITPVAKGETSIPSLDVVVNRGNFAGNLPPLVLLQANRTNTTVNAAIQFTVNATDPNNDTMAYYWDFGDGSFGSNTPAFTKSWSTAGEKVVQCTVSDMKGQQTTSTMVVRVGTVNTYRISGRILNGTEPLSGVRVSASSTRYAYTDSDGRYFITGLTSGSYTLQAQLDGFAFSRSGFANPVVVPTNRDTADFFALASNAQTLKSLITEGATWRFLDNGSNQGTGWRFLSYNDNTWSQGAAPLGYGDEERTAISFGSDSNNKHVTTYFRRVFLLEDRSELLSLTLGVRRDDGAVVYLNNREVYRGNMPSGTITYTTLASDAMSGGDETAFFETELDPAWLVNGTNLVAVEIHQSARNSSDIVFDLRLRGVSSGSLPPPTLAYERLAGTGFRVKWPDTVLQWQLSSSSTLLGEDTTWTPVLSLPQILNGQRTVTVQIGAEPQFFRLSRGE